MARGGDFSSGAGIPLTFLALFLVGVTALIYFVTKKEKFEVPVKPSQYQDKRYVTPAGNTIVY